MNAEEDANYSLPSLAFTFAQHAVDVDANTEEQARKFRLSNPGRRLPDHLKRNSFNLSRALAVICYEIEKLKSSCD